MSLHSANREQILSSRELRGSDAVVGAEANRRISSGDVLLTEDALSIRDALQLETLSPSETLSRLQTLHPRHPQLTEFASLTAAG